MEFADPALANRETRRRERPLRQMLSWLYRAVGAAIAIVIMEVLARIAGEPLARVPFVTSIVLVMALPGSDGARPYAVIGGHMLSAASGLAAVAILGAGETPAAISVGLAVLVMQAARAMHPPAGIGAMLVASQGLPVAWLLSPVMAGALLLVGFATLWSRLEQTFVDRTARVLAAARPSLMSAQPLVRNWHHRTWRRP